MDMQGTPIGSSAQGMKNTTDPASKNNPKEEGPGAIASDSLAADSARSGGTFSENRNSEPLSVSGSNSTFNNTDTSNATELSPAPDSQSRDAANADAAPGYVSSVYSEPTKSGKPHGKNITEGGFDADDSQNASFTAEVGSEDDPGRKAEGDFQKMTQSASGGTGPRQGTTEARGQGGFENLGEE